MERKAAELFSQCLSPEACIRNGRYVWQGKEYEYDLLVIKDDVALVVESKAGAITAPARRGDEQLENRREDARRLYPRVRHGAKQLRQSANEAERRYDRSAGSVQGVLFLDLDGNPYLVNLRETIREWMERPWARSIDLVLFFDYAHRNDAWGTIAEPVYSRSGRALDALKRVLPRCAREHFHLEGLPNGSCEFPLPL